MNKDILNNIHKDWVKPVHLKCLEKVAFLKEVTGAASTAAKLGAGSIIASIPATALFGALLTNKITSPKTLASVSDKLLLRNTLKTEAAVLRRKIAELETSGDMQGDDTRAFDRFI